MSIPFVILAMLFLHVIDDFFIQSVGFLANGKQRSWWEKVAPNEEYKYDYIVCLSMHAMSWAFSIMLPIAIYYEFKVGFSFVLLYIINSIIHGVVDHLKANCHKLNLIQDQSIHIIQIFVTAAIMLIL